MHLRVEVYSIANREIVSPNKLLGHTKYANRLGPLLATMGPRQWAYFVCIIDHVKSPV